MAVIIMLAGAACFWLESADRSQADWKIDAGVAALYNVNVIRK